MVTPIERGATGLLGPGSNTTRSVADVRLRSNDGGAAVNPGREAVPRPTSSAVAQADPAAATQVGTPARETVAPAEPNVTRPTPGDGVGVRPGGRPEPADVEDRADLLRTGAGDAGRRAAEAALDSLQEAAENRRSVSDVVEPALNQGVGFNPLPDLGITQAVVADRQTGETVLEVPPQERVEFLRNFNEVLSRRPAAEQFTGGTGASGPTEGVGGGLDVRG